MKLLSPSSKNRENQLRKKFLYFLTFQEMKLSSSNIKKFFIFSQKKAFLIFGETETPKKFLIFQETSYISGSNFELKKILKNPLWKNVLYFGKWNFLAPSLKNFLYFRREFAKPEKQKNPPWNIYLLEKIIFIFWNNY